MLHTARTVTQGPHPPLTPTLLLVSLLKRPPKKRVGSKRGCPPCSARKKNATRPAPAPATKAADDLSADDDDDDDDDEAPSLNDLLMFECIWSSEPEACDSDGACRCLDAAWPLLLDDASM